MKLVQFFKPNSDRPIFVNPDQVRYVTESGNNIRITFDNDHAVSVAGAIEDVVAELGAR